jgi:hypothetical protein
MKRATANYKKYKEITKHIDMTEIIRVYQLVLPIVGKFRPVTKADIREKQSLEIEMEYLEDIIGKLKTEKTCPRCKNPLYCSDVQEYDYVCAECDENFYECEVKNG